MFCTAHAGLNLGPFIASQWRRVYKIVDCKLPKPLLSALPSLQTKHPNALDSVTVEVMLYLFNHYILEGVYSLWILIQCQCQPYNRQGNWHISRCSESEQVTAEFEVNPSLYLVYAIPGLHLASQWD